MLLSDILELVCIFLRMKRHVHSPFKKSLTKSMIQYVKDRTECFDDYFPCLKENCKLKHMTNWLNPYVNYHNKEINYA